MPSWTVVLRWAAIWSIWASLARAPARLTSRPSASPYQWWVSASAMRARRLSRICSRRGRAVGSGRRSGQRRQLCSWISPESCRVAGDGVARLCRSWWHRMRWVVGCWPLLGRALLDGVDGCGVRRARPGGVPSKVVILDREGVQCAGEDLVRSAVVVALFAELVDARPQLRNFAVQRGFAGGDAVAGSTFGVEPLLEVGVLVGQLVPLQPCLLGEADDVQVAGRTQRCAGEEALHGGEDGVTFFLIGHGCFGSSMVAVLVRSCRSTSFWRAVMRCFRRSFSGTGVSELAA